MQDPELMKTLDYRGSIGDQVYRANKQNLILTIVPNLETLALQ